MCQVKLKIRLIANNAMYNHAVLMVVQFICYHFFSFVGGVVEGRDMSNIIDSNEDESFLTSFKSSFDFSLT